MSPVSGGLDIQDPVHPVQALEDLGGSQRQDRRAVGEALRIPEA